MSKDPPSTGPPTSGQPPSVSSSSKPPAVASSAAGASSSPKPPSAGPPATETPKPSSKPKKSIFERIASLSKRTSNASAASPQSPSMPAGAGAATSSSSSTPTSALAPPLPPVGGPASTRPPAPAVVKPVQPSSAPAPVVRAAEKPPSGSSKRVEEAEEAAIEDALFTSPSAPSAPLPATARPSTAAAAVSASSSSASTAGQGSGVQAKPTSPLSFKKKAPVPGASSSSAAAPLGSGARSASAMASGSTIGVLRSTPLAPNSKDSLTGRPLGGAPGPGPAVSGPAAVTSGAPEAPKMKPTFRRINPTAAPVGTPGKPAGIAPSSVKPTSAASTPSAAPRPPITVTTSGLAPPAQGTPHSSISPTPKASGPTSTAPSSTTKPQALLSHVGAAGSRPDAPPSSSKTPSSLPSTPLAPVASPKPKPPAMAPTSTQPPAKPSSASSAVPVAPVDRAQVSKAVERPPTAPARPAAVPAAASGTRSPSAAASGSQSSTGPRPPSAPSSSTADGVRPSLLRLPKPARENSDSETEVPPTSTRGTRPISQRAPVPEAVKSEEDVPLASLVPRQRTASKSKTPPAPIANGADAQLKQKPVSHKPDSGTSKKRPRAILSDTDSEPSLAAAKKQATAPTPSTARTPSQPPAPLDPHPAPLSKPTVAVQAPTRATVDDSDDDDVPLGKIIHKASSPLVSPQPPTSAERAGERIAATPKAEAPAPVAQAPAPLQPVAESAPSSASRPPGINLPSTQPPSSRPSSGPSTPIQGLFAADKDARVVSPVPSPVVPAAQAKEPAPPVAAPSSDKAAAARPTPAKQEPFYVGSDIGSDSDDDIIFIAERPPGHKLVIPPKEPSAAAPVAAADAAPVPKSEPAPLGMTSSLGKTSSLPPKRVTRHESSPSSDPLNIQRTPSPVVEKTPHSVHISPRKRRATRGSHSEVDEAEPSKKARVMPVRAAATAAAAASSSRYEPSDSGSASARSDDEDEVVVGEDDEILRMHRCWCEKCQQLPADELLVELEKKRKRGGRKKKAAGSSDDDVMSDGEAIDQMGGWIECQRCCVASHFGCLSSEQRTNLLKQVSRDKGVKRFTVEVGETSTFVCGRCAKSPACFACGSAEMQEKLGKSPAAAPVPAPEVAAGDGQKEGLVRFSGAAAVGPTSTSTMMDVDEPPPPPADKAPSPAAEEEDGEDPILFFRCFRCKRGLHYSHLQKPRDMRKASTVDIAEYHQQADWSCHDCLRWVFDVDKVIAWRPSPADAVEEPLAPGEPADYRKNLPREYLVKWDQLGFRHVEWVPHQWLLANSKQRLRNFLVAGSDLAPFLSQLSKDAAEEPGAEDGGSVAKLLELNAATELDPAAAQALPVGTAIFTASGPPAADPIADTRIPTAWKTVDRVLSVWLKRPSRRSLSKKGRGGKKVYDRDVDAEDILDLEPGLRPDDSVMVDIDEWQEITGLELDERAIEQVIWAYVKWEDLPYKLSTYDTPPAVTDTAAYDAFRKAWRGYTKGLKTIIPILTSQEVAARQAKKKFQNIRSQPSCVVGGTLLDFQMQGLNWLYSQWCKDTPCILADDMGLGKTVQIAALVGVLTSKHYYPCLIVVPNSTISNWLREFEKWIPDVRVAPYHGEKASRDIVETYELFHGEGAGGRNRGLKVHCVITTYEAVTHKSFNEVFRRVPRWEMLVADEGQRLKNDASKIVKSLATLNVAQRVLLTGTPLNNNIRELFNLMNFIDPANWNNLVELTREYESVNSDNLTALRERLKPYFLRRVKADVLNLPPKHEVIVPISMRSLQREVYKGLMMSNAELIKNLVGGIQQHGEKQATKVMKATNLSNLMMQLRKACAHPYLNQEDIEDKTVGHEEMHKRLTEGSAKLSFLKLLLPKLFQKGHRILLFSGFVIALDILSDFLDGEGIPFFRLDGNTPQAQRQKDIDSFNAPGATTNLFILSTRAGGVGINLATADTVIMFDADFNPHQDIQAIARAYRFGQKKKVIVFKLMIRNSVEEKILEKGKSKIILDQLIIQDMANEEDTDVGSLIAFGAKALFAEEEAAVKHFTSDDVDGIIQRAETAEDVSETEGGGMKFDYAEIYDGLRDGAEPAEGDGTPAAADEDFWDAIVKRAAKEKEAQEEAGRRQRRTKKTAYTDLLDSPPPSQAASPDYNPAAAASSSSSDDSDFEPPQHLKRQVEGDAAPPPPPGDKADPAAPLMPEKSHKKKIPVAGPAGAVPAAPKSAEQVQYDQLEQTIVSIGKRVNVEVVPLLQTIRATKTPPARRKELWDLAINLIAAHLEIFGVSSSIQLQPLLRRKNLAHAFLESLPYHPTGIPPAAAAGPLPAKVLAKGWSSAAPGPPAVSGTSAATIASGSTASAPRGVNSKPGPP